MKKMAVLLALGLLSVSVLCVLTPTASAVSKEYTNAQLPNIYKIEVEATQDDRITLDYSELTKYSFFLRHYDAADKALFETEFEGKNPVPRPSSSINAAGTYYVYVFTYEDPSKLSVKTSSGVNKKLTADDLWEKSNAIGGFYLYSGQKVKVNVTSGMNLFLSDGTDFISEPNLKAGKINEVKITVQGEHRIYGKNYFDPNAGTMTNNEVMFASFTIEYDKPPNTGAFGIIFLIAAAACMGSMVFFARPQKIK
jgi:hypothetical protein